MKTIKMDYEEYDRMQTRLKMLGEIVNQKTVFVPWGGEYPVYTKMEIITTREAYQQILKPQINELRELYVQYAQLRQDIADREEIKKTHWLIKKPWLFRTP